MGARRGAQASKARAGGARWWQHGGELANTALGYNNFPCFRNWVLVRYLNRKVE